MQINKTDNVIFLKDVESNIIDEAFIVLKKNVKFSENENKYINKLKIDALKEAEMIINERLEKDKNSYEKFKILKLNRKVKLLKWANIVLLTILIISFIK